MGNHLSTHEATRETVQIHKRGRWCSWDFSWECYGILNDRRDGLCRPGDRIRTSFEELYYCVKEHRRRRGLSHGGLAEAVR